MSMQAEPTEREEREFLAGQVSVLWAMCAALMQTHPNIQALTAAFYRNAELQVANELMSKATEAFEHGQAHGRDRMALLLRGSGG